MRKNEIEAGRYIAKISNRLTIVLIGDTRGEAEFVGWNERTWKLVNLTSRRLRRAAESHETVETIGCPPVAHVAPVARPAVRPMSIVQQMHAIELRDTRALSVRRRQVPTWARIAACVTGFAGGVALGVGPAAVAWARILG